MRVLILFILMLTAAAWAANGMENKVKQAHDEAHTVAHGTSMYHDRSSGVAGVGHLYDADVRAFRYGTVTVDVPTTSIEVLQVEGGFNMLRIPKTCSPEVTVEDDEVIIRFEPSTVMVFMIEEE